MFSTPTQVNFSVDNRNDRTILELVAADRPGLLSEVGKVFRAERVAINGAKIMTVGERAEDVFYITDADGGPLSRGSLPACAGCIGARARSARRVSEALSHQRSSQSIIEAAFESRAHLTPRNATADVRAAVEAALQDCSTAASCGSPRRRAAPGACTSG